MLLPGLGEGRGHVTQLRESINGPRGGKTERQDGIRARVHLRREPRWCRPAGQRSVRRLALSTKLAEEQRSLFRTAWALRLVSPCAAVRAVSQVIVAFSLVGLVDMSPVVF